MIPIYLLWLFGVLFSILFFTQIALIIYKIYKKSEKFNLNVILSIIFVFISVACFSTAVLICLNKVSDAELSYEKTGKVIGEKAADLTSNAYESFKETWDKTVPSEK